MGCELCGRDKPLSFHHLIPKALHSKKKFKKKFPRSVLKGRGIDICSLCHHGIHDLFSKKELGLDYNTKELLMENEQFLKHLKWVKKQK